MSEQQQQQQQQQTQQPQTFVVPSKVITNQNDLNRFLATDTAKELLSFIQRMGDNVIGKSSRDECIISNTTQNIINEITKMSNWIDEIPPLAQPMRYGNKAYRTFYQKVVDNIVDIHNNIVPQDKHDAIQELSPYLLDSLGNQTRLDYGTGHELHFVCWLYCLRKIDVLTSTDEIASVLKIFTLYLDLVRKLQRVYGLEPAGTHGVWSLDDYQFIPFVWGAAQLTDNKDRLKPTDILQPKLVDEFYPFYLYFSCIKFINTVKKGPFHEHSPDLYNISGAANWAKIHQGMMKKFYVEVMTKVPIIQHFLFGSIIPFSIDK
ncbi:serine/threonine-protein phosphatase 2A regulatory subunit B' [Cavenderia fasciculata]|uniref:Serine/threonine-protein phosphatase 2A activator n=1 Tax=Cavenderia fasciculata TaxID=261658 RepID=F4PX23_CACFS|nr:serine/threonine-protein phosphatase 2A regulatory subunit B' [Cavenderia fasciculata]EGG19826.1 serine/threonine-protein phosphatase 2A regulatory subunit B' [Cavenderia fasciculata]|eukprot:XP_004358172.1 serine/threonine-protein phosphatase 2A regulatory subunit B' [Cavenderia fasciculata]